MVRAELTMQARVLLATRLGDSLPLRCFLLHLTPPLRLHGHSRGERLLNLINQRGVAACGLRSLLARSKELLPQLEDGRRNRRQRARRGLAGHVCVCLSTFQRGATGNGGHVSRLALASYYVGQSPRALPEAVPYIVGAVDGARSGGPPLISLAI